VLFFAASPVTLRILFCFLILGMETRGKFFLTLSFL
jgi:hypothetical protein